MISPRFLPVSDDLGWYESSRIRDNEWNERAKNGTRVLFQKAGAESYAGPEAASGDFIKVPAGKEAVTFITAKGMYKKALPGFTQNSLKAQAFDRFNESYEAQVHTYPAALVTQEHFKHYGIQDPIKEIGIRKTSRKPIQRLVEEQRIVNGKRVTTYKFIAHSHDTEFELRRGTRFATSNNWMLRKLGQILQRLSELGEGVGQSLRDPLDTGKTGGRVIFTSVLLNVFVLGLVASFGYYELHKNDEAAQKILDGNAG